MSQRRSSGTGTSAAHYRNLVTALTAGLQNPLQPRFCPGCLDIVATDLGVFENELKREQMFVVVTGNMESPPRAQINTALMTVYAQCPESRGGTAYTKEEHRDAILYIGRDAVFRSANLFAAIVSKSLKSLDRHTTQRFTRRGLWPRVVGDVLPGGELATVSGLHQFCKNELDRQPYTLMLGEAMSVYLADLVRCAAQPLSGGQYSEAWNNLRVATHILAHLSLCSYRTQYDDWLPLAPRILDLMQVALSITTDRETRVIFAKFGWTMLGICQDRSPDTVHPLIRSNGGGGDPPNPFGELHGLIVRIAQRRACGWPACARTERDMGRKLKEAHWNAGHKKTCKALRNLATRIGSTTAIADVSESTFVGTCRRQLRGEWLQEVAQMYGMIYVDVPHMRGVAVEVLAQNWMEEVTLYSLFTN
ncbi:hypothetical protein EXIGLDRAFT_783647 [Exidia glandulosa HHB12029]|uniref:Uncharacterized protein n=1 Tax=Exidia glandulosa HHB12029 TaxID=1314781 RepID=A0A166MYK0_EXIGL|nr:hypothetical protein EXIGLDRAFT_783647 [Exidia glandulosa HHB12029]